MNTPLGVYHVHPVDWVLPLQSKFQRFSQLAVSCQLAFSRCHGSGMLLCSGFNDVLNARSSIGLHVSWKHIQEFAFA